MRKEKALIGLLRGLVDLVAEESVLHPAFALKLDTLLTELPKRKAAPKRSAITPLPEHLPNIHAEWTARGETDFRLWLRGQPIPVLRAIIRAEDFDATRRTTKWKETEKLAEFIADSLRSRQSRGSAFIGRGFQDRSFAPSIHPEPVKEPFIKAERGSTGAPQTVLEPGANVLKE